MESKNQAHMGCQSSTVAETNGNALLEPVKLGSVQLKNRVIMAAMSRTRADPKTGVPTDMMAEYFEQRAGFGAIITDSTTVSPLSFGGPGAPAIYNKDHVEGWKKVTQRVHAKGGKIFLQLFHTGRATVPELIGGATPIAPSPIAIRGPHKFTKQPYAVPKEMTKEDIKEVIQQFKQGAINAKEAGFDGVEIHGANGFLIDQFLKDSTNHRTDEYGGSVQNRSRFCLEVIDAAIGVFGSDRVGLKLTPTGRFGDIYDSNPLELIKHLLKELEKRKLAFVEVKRHAATDNGKSADATVDEEGRTYANVQIPNFFDAIRPLYSGTLILNDGIDQATGIDLVKSKKADAISFAGLAICNPDLPERFLNGWELAKPDYMAAYTVPSGPQGYIDFPNFKQ